MSADGFVELRGHAGEDYSLTATIEGTGSIASGWTFAGHLWDAAGAEIAGAVSVAITDAANRVIVATVSGQALAATPYYGPLKWEVRRTDAGARTVICWGTLDLVDARQV